jgi:NAD(P)-dependent dehydrogenase (short-subunit alcohol dehydrogenase family)
LARVTALPLAGQAAIVTGAGRGIGRATAFALAAAGAAVVVVARTGAEIEATAAAIVTAGGRAVPMEADVTDRAAVEAMAAAALQAFGPIGTLVNNAGSHVGVGHIWEVDPDLWWRDVETNLLGTFLVSRAVLPGMLARQQGCIINIASGAALEPRPFSSAYAGAKAAMLRLTDSLAADVAQQGVRVFALHPGGVRTGLTETIMASEAGRSAYPSWQSLAWQPPERAAAAVVALAAGEADALSGRYVDATVPLAEQVAAVQASGRPELFTLRLARPPEGRRGSE